MPGVEEWVVELATLPTAILSAKSDSRASGSYLLMQHTVSNRKAGAGVLKLQLQCVDSMWGCPPLPLRWVVWKSFLMRPQLLSLLSPDRLNVGLVFPCLDPIHFHSHWCGQDHGMKSFLVGFQSLVAMSLNPHFVTWLKAMGARGRSRLKSLADGKPAVSGLCGGPPRIPRTCIGYTQLEYQTGG